MVSRDRPDGRTDEPLRIEGAARVWPKDGFILLAVFLYALVPVALGLVVATGTLPLLVFAVHGLLFGSMAFSYGRRSVKNARATSGTLVVTPTSIALGGERIARRQDLAQGFVVPTRYGTLVRLDRPWPWKLAPPLLLRVRDAATARDVLRTLGFDVTRTAAEMRIASGLLAAPAWAQALILGVPIAALALAVFAVGLTMPRTGGPIVFAAVTLIVAYALGLSFAPTTVRVGSDGIATRWLGRSRFYRHRDVERVEIFDEYVANKRHHGVHLRLRSGRTVRLPTGQTDVGQADAAQLAERIEEARAVGGRGHGEVSAMLARGGRPALEWVRALRRLGVPGLDWRTASAPHDALLGIVEDSAATGADRASAAVSAVSTGEETAIARVRIAAEATASAELRAVLIRIADAPGGEADDEIAAALDELSGGRERLARGRSTPG